MTENLKCGKCGREFQCGRRNSSCWCSAIKIDRDSLELLNKTFEGCLCPSCLSEYITIE